jgi:hypothetical protein
MQISGAEAVSFAPIRRSAWTAEQRGRAPVRHHVNRDEARAALQRIRARAEQSKLGHFDWPEWKAYRDEGRP